MGRTDAPPNGQAQFITKDKEFNFIGKGFRGWARITSNGQPLAVASVEVQARGARLLGIDGVSNHQMQTRLVCGDITHSSGEPSTLYVLNADNQAAQVRVRLFKQANGKKAAETNLTVPARSVIVVSPTDPLWSGISLGYRGIAIVDADRSTSPKLAVMVRSQFVNKNKAAGAAAYLCSRF